MSTQAAITRAEKALEAFDEKHKPEQIDPGMQSMRFHETETQSRKRITGYINQQRRLSQEREALVNGLETARRNHRIAQLPTEPIDPALLKTATHVLVREHYRVVWYEVRRINPKTVTCKVEPGFDEPRVPYHLIVGVR